MNKLWTDQHHLALELEVSALRGEDYISEQAWTRFNAIELSKDQSDYSTCYGKQFYVSLDVFSTVCVLVRYYPGRLKISWLDTYNHCRMILSTDMMRSFRTQRLGKSLNWGKIVEFLAPLQDKGKVDAAFYRFAYSLLTSHRYTNVTRAKGRPGCQVLDLLGLRTRFKH